MSKNTDKIVKVAEYAFNRFVNGQCEIVFRAKSEERKGYRWYVAFGGDYRPATKSEIDNFELLPYEVEDAYTGMHVQKYVRTY